MDKKKIEDALVRAKVEENEEIESVDDILKEDMEFKKDSKKLKKMLK